MNLMELLDGGVHMLLISYLFAKLRQANERLPLSIGLARYAVIWGI
jgi:hypothetical protein